MLRREFLKSSGVFAANILAAQVISSVAMSRRASADTGLPLESLFASLDASQALLLVPSSKQFAAYQVAFNKRTMQTPQVRAVCKTPQAIAIALQWAKTNKVSFAIRGGGHSYDGFSQSKQLVIDLRLMTALTVNASDKQATVGAGLALGDVYKAVAPYKMAIAAGSGPTVGVAGHTAGGGFGMMARANGLACDNLESLELVDARGRVLHLSQTENSDLFWACRGGGNGSLGVITKLNFKLHEVHEVSTFGASWTLSPANAAKVVKTWQEWAPDSPDAITSIFRISKENSSTVKLRCLGQSIDSESSLFTEVKRAFKALPPSSFQSSTFAFIDAVNHFSGGWNYESVYMKGKSDYLFNSMSDKGIASLINGVATNAITVMMDCYGGAVNRVPQDATAFAHRKGTRYSIQYYSQWANAADTPAKLQNMRDFYASMRPFVSGAAYVNYGDRDLTNFADAYWGANLPRLTKVKVAYDPENFFNNGQGIPLA